MSRFPPIADIEVLSHTSQMNQSADVCLVYFELGSGSAKFRDEGYAGGFVTVFVPTPDLRGALNAAEAALVADGYEVVDIDKATRYDPEEWEHDEDVNSAVAVCMQTGEIGYSTFTTWGH